MKNIVINYLLISFITLFLQGCFSSPYVTNELNIKTNGVYKIYDNKLSEIWYVKFESKSKVRVISKEENESDENAVKRVQNAKSRDYINIFDNFTVFDEKKKIAYVYLIDQFGIPVNSEFLELEGNRIVNKVSNIIKSKNVKLINQQGEVFFETNASNLIVIPSCNSVEIINETNKKNYFFTQQEFRILENQENLFGLIETETFKEILEKLQKSGIGEKLSLDYGNKAKIIGTYGYMLVDGLRYSQKKEYEVMSFFNRDGKLLLENVSAIIPLTENKFIGAIVKDYYGNNKNYFIYDVGLEKKIYKNVDDIRLSLSKNRLIVISDKKTGVVDFDGNEIFTLQEDKWIVNASDKIISYFVEYEKNRKIVNLMDYNGNIIIKKVLSFIPVGEDTNIVNLKNGKYIVIDNNGKKILKDEYSEIGYFDENIFIVGQNKSKFDILNVRSNNILNSISCKSIKIDKKCKIATCWE